MHKTIVALRRRTGAPDVFDPAASSGREALAPLKVQIACCAIDLPADRDLYDQLGRRPATAPAWDAVAHVWHRTSTVPPVLGDYFEAVACWTVDEYTAWDRGVAEREVPSRGIKQISFVGARADLRRQEFADRYRSHVDVARVHHAGARKYQQNTVVDGYGSASTVAAVSEFWFDSVHDLVHEYYAFDDSSAITRADAAMFLDPATTTWMLVHEYWMMPDPAA